MAQGQHVLKDLQVKSAKAGATLRDGGGLTLRVSSEKGKGRWSYRFKRRNYPQREMGLGAYPGVSLAEARKKCEAARALVAQGIDPIDYALQEAKEHQAAAQAATAAEVTFAEYAEIFLPVRTRNLSNKKHVAQWATSFRVYAAPLAHKPLVTITRNDILAVLEPLWETRHVTATRLRGRLENLFDHAIQNEAFSGSNPARWARLNYSLSKPRKLTGKHHPAMPREDVPAFVEALRSQRSMGALALEFLVLTAARSGEVRLACWNEFDFEAGLWTLSAERMKMKRPHAVPLSPRAIEILKEARAFRGKQPSPDSYVFEGEKEGRPLSDMTLRAVMRRMDLKQYVPHGFRSAFRMWATIEAKFPRELAEEALAHQLGAVERAYLQDQDIEGRRVMMQSWQGFVDGRKLDGASIVPFRVHV